MIPDNSVIEWDTSSGVPETLRILKTGSEHVAMFNFRQKGIETELITLRELKTELDGGRIRVIQDPYEKLRLSNQSETSRKHADDNFNLIKKLVADTAILFDAAERQNRVSDLADGNRSLKVRITRVLHNWFLKGQAMGALFPEYGKNLGKPHRTAKKPGRKSSAPVITEEYRQRMDEACQKYLLRKSPLSVMQAYEELLADLRKKYPEMDESDMPSHRQFRYHYYSRYSIKTRILAQTPSISYEKDVRPLHGGDVDLVSSIGEIYQIDSTPADVNLVSFYDRSKIVGRPTLFLVRDVFSGMITGFNVSFDPAQFKSSACAILSAIRSKSEQMKACGSDYSLSDWACSGVPAMIMADNGELAGSSIESLAAACGVSICNTPPYRADCKGAIEEAFNAVQQSLKANLTGVPCRATLKKAGARDTRPEATLTLPEYTKMLIGAIISANRHNRMRTPPGFPPELLPTSLNIWNWAHETGRSVLKHGGNSENIRMTLLPRYEVTVSRNGVRCKGMLYTCAEAERQGWFERITRPDGPDRKQARLVIDPDNVSKSWLVPDFSAIRQEYWPCRLSSENGNFSGLSLYEAECWQREAASARDKGERANELARGIIREKQRKIAKEAAKATSESIAASGKTARERVAEIKENRRLERSLSADSDHASSESGARGCSTADADGTKRQTDKNLLGGYAPGEWDFPDLI